MKEGRCIWSLALVQSLVSIKVPTGFTAALVPPHVLAEVLLADHTAIDCPLVPHAFVGQSSCRGGRRSVTQEAHGWGLCSQNKAFMSWISAQIHPKVLHRSYDIILLNSEPILHRDYPKETHRQSTWMTPLFCNASSACALTKESNATKSHSITCETHIVWCTWCVSDVYSVDIVCPPLIRNRVCISYQLLEVSFIWWSGIIANSGKHTRKPRA